VKHVINLLIVKGGRPNFTELHQRRSAASRRCGFPTDDVAKLREALCVVLDDLDQPSRVSRSGNAEQRRTEPFSDTLIRLYRGELAAQARSAQPN
jgi:hypothetical protein